MALHPVYQQLRDRQIRHLVHFTRVENLESILRHGLLSRQDLERLQLPYRSNDLHRWDGHLEAICLSISFPNCRMFYSLRGKLPRGWVVLLLNPEIILPGNVLYMPGNAACARFGGADTAAYRGPAAFARMFAPAGRAMLPDCYTTDVQAEILMQARIDAGHIQSLHVCDERTAHRVRLAVYNSRRSVPVVQDKFYFEPRPTLPNLRTA